MCRDSTVIDCKKVKQFIAEITVQSFLADKKYGYDKIVQQHPDREWKHEYWQARTTNIDEAMTLNENTPCVPSVGVFVVLSRGMTKILYHSWQLSAFAELRFKLAFVDYHV